MAKLGPFIVGGVVGAVAGLLYAPRAGAQTRALVSEKVNAVWGEASDFAQSAGVVAPGVVIQDVAANAQAVAQNVQAKVQGVTQVAPEPEPVAEADNDDLREKIEAARERIAAQVVKNAEESRAQVATPIETAPVEAPAEAPAAEAAETPAE